MRGPFNIFGRKPTLQVAEEAKPAFNEIVEEMAEAFRTGKILEEDLGPDQICTLVVRYLGKRLEAKWYPFNRWIRPPERNYRLIWVRFNDQTHLGPDDEAEYIKDAARWRATHRLQEMSQALLTERAAFKSKDPAP
jgi:hypothetical protein